MAVVVFNEDAFNYLINFTQDFSVVNKHGWNIVHRIAFFRNNDDDDVVPSRMLMKLSEKTNVEILINNKTHNGRTPLHWAARRNHHRVVETIVKLGGDFNIKDNDNRLPDEYDECDDETILIIQRLRRQW